MRCFQKGNAFIFAYHTNTFSATIAFLQTLWARVCCAVAQFKEYKSVESRNGEKRIKAPNRRNLNSRPGARENGEEKDFVCPYREPRKVPLAEKAKTSQGITLLREFGNNSPVS